MMQEDNHVLQIEYIEDDYNAFQKKKGNKGYNTHKIHQDISSKTKEEIPALKGQSVKRTMLKLSTIKGKQ